jgi:small subunit ribosomal protein S17
MSQLDTEIKHVRKTRTGKVVGDKMNKTIVVAVERRVAHEMYGKIIKRSKKFYVHDEKNEAREGDTVRIQETRPLSKLKSWRLLEILQRGNAEHDPVSLSQPGD